ncbi:MAG: hypothetical protein HOP15_08040 [Planctomycetes bacterium]|nr:hypothetical protein [Planctomycetota bacterium]
MSDSPEGCQARVHIEGPRYQTSIETDDEGKARLSLVGAGTFRFRAVQRSGREGEAVLELEADADLDSIVITTALPKH